MKKLKIKLEAAELRRKSIKELEKIKKELEIHLMKAKRKKVLDEGFNVKEERRNISRILTILNERKNDK